MMAQTPCDVQCGLQMIAGIGDKRPDSTLAGLTLDDASLNQMGKEALWLDVPVFGNGKKWES